MRVIEGWWMVHTIELTAEKKFLSNPIASAANFLRVLTKRTYTKKTKPPEFSLHANTIQKVWSINL